MLLIVGNIVVQYLVMTGGLIYALILIVIEIIVAILMIFIVFTLTGCSDKQSKEEI